MSELPIFVSLGGILSPLDYPHAMKTDDFIREDELLKSNHVA